MKRLLSTITLVLALGLCPGHPLLAKDASSAPSDAKESAKGKNGVTKNVKIDEEDAAKSYFRPPRNPNKRRNYILWPLLSLLAPGVDQWVEGQYGAAATYTGISLAGNAYALANYQAYYNFTQSDTYANMNKDQKSDWSMHDETARRVQFGFQLGGGPLALGLGAMSSLSAYHAFRTAVTTRYQDGKFSFLDPKYEETPADIALAPFNFKYLARLTTIIPLSVVATLAYATYTQTPDPNSNTYRWGLTSSDVFYASSTSYLAGMHEEALFRGFMMPCFMQWTDSPFWSNSITAVVFAAAHMNQVQVPLAQLGMGWYWGWLAQHRNWTIGEGVFMHAWYDTMIFLASYHVRYQQNPPAGAALPILWLPPLSMAF